MKLAFQGLIDHVAEDITSRISGYVLAIACPRVGNRSEAPSGKHPFGRLARSVECIPRRSTKIIRSNQITNPHAIRPIIFGILES
jgi:hypothetical protein